MRKDRQGGSVAASHRGGGLPAESFRAREERLAAGDALRSKVARRSHAAWAPHARRRDPLAILQRSNAGRLPELVPIRFGRMLRSPFTFLRGSAGLMAHDLAQTPVTGRYGKVCGGVLARAHAKSGDAATITGYLGKSDNFDRAVAAFAVAYADQTERDHGRLARAVRDGRVEALVAEA